MTTADEKVARARTWKQANRIAIRMCELYGWELHEIRIEVIP